ncbi:outer membrane protein with beta-barrel domain [Winogradskyella wandonensis]|uniref:Outer membrane protein with beta-barrel domain n=1 Tax=Winogradskyella wandonensis TaxID=1442586 RepID=A0A4R1KVK2_9FLAO|nr:outer membrane beta-barrel protein [Winogradskyella wandonensis]TCK68750.1 outer membrane protein with beta-barrel domain [Winogradskyella wandonensis]
MSNKLVSLLAFLLVSLPSVSQQLYFELGTTISAFDYENSQGQPLDNLISTSKSYYGMGYRQSINPAETMFLNVGLSYNNYGAIGSEASVDNFFEWDVSYLGLKAGLGIKLFQVRDLTFLANLTVAPEFLIRGTQTINNSVFNLVGEEEFNNTILFFRGGIQMQYPVSSSTAITAGYSYGQSALINSGDTRETLNLNAHQFGIGFIINLPSCNCDF